MPEGVPPTHRLGKGPDFANSSRLLAAPFQRRASGRRKDVHQPRHPGDLISSAIVSNRLTLHHSAFSICIGPRFHACRAVALRRRVRAVPPSQIAEDRLPRRRERGSFRQVPSAGRPRIRALAKLPALTPPPTSVRPLPLRASRWPYACPPPARRRPPSHPAAISRKSAAPRPGEGQQP